MDDTPAVVIIQDDDNHVSCSFVHVCQIIAALLCVPVDSKSCNRFVFKDTRGLSKYYALLICAIVKRGFGF